MYSTIYVESEIKQSSLTQSIINRFRSADIVECNRYTEVFNRKGQDFRLQKQHPSLILARKHSGHVLSTPQGYGVGGEHNYYFSIMLNCIYDCRYCFLQGMYRSAHHVIFVNYEDFAAAIQKTALKHSEDEAIWFFSGYDCDSLAMEPVAGFADYFIDSVCTKGNIWLELRTKSTQVRTLLNREVNPTVVVAFSFTPNEVSRTLEHKVSSVNKRIDAMSTLQQNGWSVGLRFDPLIFSPGYRTQYRQLFESIFSTLDDDLLHSVSIGVFRLPRHFYRTLERLYPDDRFLAQPFVRNNGQVSYPKFVEQEMKEWCLQELGQFISQDKVFVATTESN